MAHSDFQIASTYLKLLVHQPELMNAVRKSLPMNLDQLLSQEFIKGEQIAPIFSYFAEQGLDSWILKFGSQLGSSTHGPLGFAVLSAPNLEAALNVLNDYSCIRTTAYSTTFSRKGGRLVLTAENHTNSELMGRWLIEAGIHVTQRLVENIMAHELGQHGEITFVYPEPSYGKELQRFFKVPCRFDQNSNSISIPESWGRIASPLSDPGTFQTNLNKCKELKLTLLGKTNTLGRVKAVLDLFLSQSSAGEKRPSELPTLSGIANSLAMSERTLARRLNDQGTSYKALLEEARQQHSQSLLKNTHLSIADISYYLGYQESANFVRAFKRWNGTPPSKWRREPRKTIQNND